VKPAAAGFKIHTGWAAAVAVAASPSGPLILDRRRLPLSDLKETAYNHVYHQAENLPEAKAADLVAKAERAARAKAVESFKRLAADLAKAGFKIRAASILVGSGRLPPTLGEILKSHVLIHTAEGDLFRRALAWGCGECGVAVVETRSRDLDARAMVRMAGLRKTVGSPWAREQQEAALAAWQALANES
jgi:hypothetical protein